MNRALSAIALLTSVMAAPIVSARPANDTGILLSGGPMPDLSGTYVRALQPISCSLMRGSSISPALYIAQSNSTITLRVFSTSSTRVLRIERRESAAQNLETRNGLARWNGEELIVETKAPAFPLWDGPHAVVPGSKLKESFLPTTDDRLIYRTWYMRPDDEAHGPYEVRLAKCRSHL